MFRNRSLLTLPYYNASKIIKRKPCLCRELCFYLELGHDGLYKLMLHFEREREREREIYKINIKTSRAK